MCNDTNDRLFRAVRTTTYTDTAALEALRTALTRQGCSAFTKLEDIIRHQLVTMAREANDFNDLLTRLNEAGPDYLATQFAPAGERERGVRTRESARNALARDYREDVEGLVGMIRDEVRGGQIEDIEALDTYIHETIDGCERVIYTQLAREACIFSDNNEDAWQEYVSADSGNLDWSAMAYWVVRQDVIDDLGDIVHDEDAFDLLRAEGGFTVSWEDACEVIDELADNCDEGDQPEPSTPCHISRDENEVWVLRVTEGSGQLAVAIDDEDEVLELIRDYQAA